LEVLLSYRASTTLVVGPAPCSLMK